MAVSTRGGPPPPTVFQKRLSRVGNWFVDPLGVEADEEGAALGEITSPTPSRTTRSRVRRGSEDDEDNLVMPRPAAVITTQKEMSLSGNYYILSDHSELEHDHAADFDEEAEADSDRLLAFERGLLPLDIAWFFNVRRSCAAARAQIACMPAGICICRAQPLS